MAKSKKTALKKAEEAPEVQPEASTAEQVAEAPKAEQQTAQPRKKRTYEQVVEITGTGKGSLKEGQVYRYPVSAAEVLISKGLAV